MSDVAISVESISKRYRIGMKAKIPNTFGSALADIATRPIKNFRRIRQFSKFGKNGHEADDVIWALKDVSFEIEQGQVVGIIGRNGAGKSTLLKILTRITQPTTGRAVARGRVASLLEVGTGFHPELTGRENVYLNGAILGMRRKEINRKFDEIVDFSGVEKFIDTPVKRYSSGMKVRLAFGVAAHLEPDILLIDEVLAVGDAEFQRKCLGKMQDVTKEGRTVLFVSHNMATVRNLCPRVIYLDEGRVKEDGNTHHVLDKYLSGVTDWDNSGEMDLRDWPHRYGSSEARVVQARLINQYGQTGKVFFRLQPMTIEFTLESQCELRLNLSLVCMTFDGIKTLQLAHQDTPGFTPGVVNGVKRVHVEIPALPLQGGNYRWAIGIHTEGRASIDTVLEVLPFLVEDDLRLSPRPFRSTNDNGLCSVIARWAYAPVESDEIMVDSTRKV